MNVSDFLNFGTSKPVFQPTNIDITQLIISVLNMYKMAAASIVKLDISL